MLSREEALAIRTHGSTRPTGKVQVSRVGMARLARSSALAPLLLAATAISGWADDDVLRFDGRVEPLQRVIVANHLDGIVDEVLFSGGETVAAGDVLIVIDPKSFEIAVDRAGAALAEAEAELRLAEDIAARAAELLARGPGTEVAKIQAELARDAAAARVAAYQAELANAVLDLDRTRIEAPISGQIGRPLVAPGTFVEAEAGTELGEIVTLDPVLVAYAVPWSDRVAAMQATGSETIEELFEQIVLTLTLPSGAAYPHEGQPRFESAEIDRENGALTTWGEFPNPDGLLVPGLAVGVLAHIGQGDTTE
ncbi:MAG: efflux RND transporter periplasmic adaptor subunit [Pseudomonadota bacterium]